MKNILSASGFALLAGFVLFATGCVAQYESSFPATSYSSTTLPAAGTVALVMEFRGGEPTPEERADVRALLAEYFSQQGTVLVDETEAADYLVHAVLERRNPANPTEWTVVETYSANSLRSVGTDEFRWPGGLIEDDYYDTTTYSYIGFGLFYPVFFDLWSDPWHRGHVILRPPPRRHSHWTNDRWRDDHRWHRPTRWHGDRRPDGSDRKRPDWNRDGRRDRPDNLRPDRGNRDRRDGIRPDRDHRDGDRRPDNDYRRDNDRRGGGDHGRTPSADAPRSESPVTTVQRPPRPERPRPVGSPQIAPPDRSQSRPDTHPAEVRGERPRRGNSPMHGQGAVAVRPPRPQPLASPPPSQVQPADRRGGAPHQLPARPEHRGRPGPEVRERARETPSAPPAGIPPQVRAERRDQPPPPTRQASAPRPESRRPAVAPPAERARPSPDRRPHPQNNDNDKDNDRPPADQIPRRR